MATERRRWVRSLAAAVGVAAAGDAAAQPPAAGGPSPSRPAAVAPAAAPRVVAFLYGNVPVSRDELHDYLIARGGMDRVDAVVNRKIIDAEAARQGVTVTPLEIDAGVTDDIRGSNLDRHTLPQFLKERYGKTLYEWEQDVVRNRLLLTKLARGRVTVTDEHRAKAFEVRYGERREAQVIVWPKGPGGLSDEVKAIALANPAEYDKLAVKQPNKELAAAAGRTAPVGRHLTGEDPKVVQALFELKAGEAKWVETEAASTAVRCLKVIPTDPANTPANPRVKAEIDKDAVDLALADQVPDLFAELKKAAAPALTVHVPQRPVTDPRNPPPAHVQHPDPRVLAVLANGPPVTRDDLGEFLLARGGYEQLEFLVNQKIILGECGKRGVGVTAEEVRAGKADYCKRLGVGVDDFVRHMLPKRGMHPFAWEQDVIVPELLLGKLCRERVQVTADDLRKAFENRYGEKRKAKIIIWPKEQHRTALREWGELRKGATPAERDAAFDRVARQQVDVGLAAGAGVVEPIGRHTGADNPLIEQTVFSLQEGEVSQLFEIPAGIMCVKCVGTVPARIGVAFDGVKAELEKEVFERKLAREIPAYFGGLKAAAAPRLLLKGPPTAREAAVGAGRIADQAAERLPVAPAGGEPRKK